MAKCPACGKPLSPTRVATCSACSSKYHKECVGMQSNDTMSKGWVCPECTRKKPRCDNSATPVKAIGLSPPREPGYSGGLLQPQSTPTEVATPVHSECGDEERELGEMKRQIAEYIVEMRKFHEQFRTSMDRITERMDGFERRLGVLEQREVSINPEEVVDLRQKVVQLQVELNERDQDALLGDIDIGHLPEEKGENVVHSVTTLAARLGVTLEDRDIVFAERVGAAGSGGARPRRVVVRLARRQLRDDMVRAARVRRTLTAADAGSTGPPGRIFVNERLTRTNRQLFHLAREECRKQQWRYSWTRRGRIYVRRADGDQAYPIRSDGDIARVFGS